jgi:murein DD-endopeptidase MepM/ murein hydrolase activator NlpD
MHDHRRAMTPVGKLLVMGTALLLAAPTAEARGKTRAPAASLSASLAAGIDAALDTLEAVEHDWQASGVRLAHQWKTTLAGVDRKGILATWVRAFGDGADSLLGVIDPSRVIPRFGLQTYRILSARPVPGKITSDFGFRRDPIHHRLKYHKGIDFRGDRGTPIRAAAAGLVTLAQRWGGYGNCVVIDHGAGIETRYGHMTRFRVKQGDYVAANAFIGTVGETGRATGPHLHFEIREQGRPINPLDAFVDGEPPPREPANLWELLGSWSNRDDFRKTVKPLS